MSKLPLDPSASRICIIGAGACGLMAARLFKEEGFTAQVFEATSHIGGTWMYSSDPSATSAMYKSLRCNIPKEIMCYREEPFAENTNSFVEHAQVLKYLQNFAEKHKLHDLIRLNTRVTAVTKQGEAWRIECEPKLMTYADAVVVCNGHYSVPNKWSAPGSDSFVRSGGVISHSQHYKEPHEFTDKRVLVIGSGPSGMDIGYEISHFASHLYISHRQPTALFKDEVRSYITEVPQVERFVGGRDIQLVDNTIIRDIDYVLNCTGYKYDFPFLKPGEAGVSVSRNGHCVKGLMKHLVAKQDVTLAFPGLPWSVIPFPLFQDQIAFLIALYRGKISMRRLRLLHERDRPPAVEDKYYHKFGAKQWEYRRELASLAGREPVSTSEVEVAHDSSSARRRDFTEFREREYRLLGPGPGEWRVFVDGEDVTGCEDPDVSKAQATPSGEFSGRA